MLLARIKNFQNKKTLYLLIGGTVNFITVLCIVWISTFVADQTFYFSKPARLFILILNGGITLLYFYKFILRHIFVFLQIRKSGDYTSVAREIGQNYTGLSDRLANIYQLYRNNGLNASEELRAAAINQFNKETEQINFQDLVRFKSFLYPLFFITGIIIFSIMLVLIIKDPLYTSAKRIANPFGDYEIVPDFQFDVNPGNTKLVKGNSLNIEVKYTGPKISECYVLYVDTTGNEIIMTMVSQGEFYNFVFEDLRSAGKYQIIAEPVSEMSWKNKLRSDFFDVSILNPPQIADLQIQLIPPAYTRLEDQYLENNIGDIIAYKGTRVKMRAVVNKKLTAAKIEFSDKSESGFRIQENKILNEFNILKNIRYKILLTDRDEIKNVNPIEYEIVLLEDYYPVVSIPEPGTDIELTPDAAFNMIIEARDDFGFHDMQLNYQILGNSAATMDSSWKTLSIQLSHKNTKYLTKNYIWDLSLLPVGYQESIKYYVSVTDNDQIDGPKRSNSKIYFIRFPSLEQLFEEFAGEQEKSIEEFEDIADESEELEKELEKIKREIKKEKELAWDKKQEIESTMEKQRRIQERFEQIEKKLDEAIKKLAEKNLFSPEILEKYRQLQDLFREIATPELLESMEELQKALENFNKNKVDQALNKLQINQEKFKQALDRTLELFKRVELEQEIDRLAQLSKRLKEEQNKITDSLEEGADNQKNDLNRMAEKEKNIAENIRQMNRSLSDLLDEDLLQKYQETIENLMRAEELSGSDKMKQNFEKMQQNLQNANMQQSGNTSRNLSRQLKQMQQLISQAQQNMQAQDKSRLMAKMQRVTDNLLKLSKDEEKLFNKTDQISNLNDRFADITSDQQRNYENLNRVIREIIEISRETFFLPQELNKSLGGASGSMRKSLRELEELNKNAARQNQKKAIASLNTAVMHMQSSMQSMAQSGSSIGFEQFLQQMQKMAGQQGQLNEQSLNFMQGRGNRGMLSPEQQAELSRMAAQQRAIQKEMESLNQDYGQKSDVLGDLKNLAEEMEEIAQDFENMKIDRNTIQRQQKILTRMLDAQKSVREREISRKRKAETGKEYARKGPSELLNSEDKNKIDTGRILQEALREGYAPDYEKLIEEYFRKLNEAETK